jgi:hypothetical protein
MPPNEFRPGMFQSVIDEFTDAIHRDFGPFSTFEIDQVRRVPYLDGSLFLLISKEGIDGKWLCEDLFSERFYWVDESRMSSKIYNEMEVLAWAAR